MLLLEKTNQPTEGHLGRTRTSVDGHIGRCWHCTGDLFFFIWSLEALGQPDSLECSLAGLARLMTFTRLPRDACLALSSAFYKVPQSQAVHKQVG